MSYTVILLQGLAQKCIELHYTVILEPVVAHRNGIC